MPLTGCSASPSRHPESIARTRTMVQRYALELASHLPRAVVWVLDDDKRLDDAVLHLVDRLRALREAGHAWVLGRDLGAPPLPAASTLRLGLLDLLHNLRWLSRLEPTASLPDRDCENRANERRFKDFYYDLSADSGHLETPWWITPAHEGETVREALARQSSSSSAPSS